MNTGKRPPPRTPSISSDEPMPPLPRKISLPTVTAPPLPADDVRASVPMVLESKASSAKRLDVPSLTDSEDDLDARSPTVVSKRPAPSQDTHREPPLVPVTCPPTANADSDNESETSELSVNDLVVTALLCLSVVDADVRLKTIVPHQREKEGRKAIAETLRITKSPSLLPTPKEDEMSEESMASVFSRAQGEFSLCPKYVANNPSAFRPPDWKEFSN